MKPPELFQLYMTALRQEHTCYDLLVELQRQGIGICEPEMIKNLQHLAYHQQQVWHGLSQLENPFYYLLAATPTGLGETEPIHEVKPWGKYVSVPTWLIDPDKKK